MQFIENRECVIPLMCSTTVWHLKSVRIFFTPKLVLFKHDFHEEISAIHEFRDGIMLESWNFNHISPG